MSEERPVPEGWESRSRLYGVGTANDDAILADAVERIAIATDGLDSAGETAAAYEAFNFPYDDARWAVAAADQLSSCAIYGLQVLDCLGYEAPQTDTPYQPRLGRAVTDVVQLGVEVNAWLASVGRRLAWHGTTAPGSEIDLPTGPHLALVGNNAGEGLEHVFVGLSGPSHLLGGAIPVSEGGQPSKRGRGYSIQRSRYELIQRGPGQLWARRVGSVGNGRRLRGWLDIGALPLTQRCVLPA